ncbi:MAG: hypothetical protein AB1806_10760, partial [Acidobacteriota bacterium]
MPRTDVCRRRLLRGRGLPSTWRRPGTPACNLRPRRLIDPRERRAEHRAGMLQERHALRHTCGRFAA